MRSVSLFNNYNHPFKTVDLFDLFGKNFDTEVSSKATFGFSSDFRLNSDKTQWDLTIEVPGVAKEDLKLDAKEGHLEVRAHKKKGIDIGEFSWTVKLPDGINYEKIDAVFEDGVLTMAFPLEEKKTLKTIQIR